MTKTEGDDYIGTCVIQSVQMVINTSTTDLARWLRNQYGRGKTHKSPRALSLAASDGKNHNLVYDIVRRGTADPETLVKLAKVLDVSAVHMFIIAGWLTEQELNSGLTDRDRHHLENWRKLPQEDQDMLDQFAERLLNTA